jgi:hypothetical protein
MTSSMMMCRTSCLDLREMKSLMELWEMIRLAVYQATILQSATMRTICSIELISSMIRGIRQGVITSLMDELVKEPLFFGVANSDRSTSRLFQPSYKKSSRKTIQFDPGCDGSRTNYRHPKSKPNASNWLANKSNSFYRAQEANTD